MGNCEEELPKKPVGRLSVNCQPTVDRQVTDSLPTALSADSRPTGFLGSSSSQLPVNELLINNRQHVRKKSQAS